MSEPSPLEADRGLSECMRRLAKLDFMCRVNGADLSAQARVIAADEPEVLEWLRHSDELVRNLHGSRRLRRRRRRGILRHRSGPDIGLPFFGLPLNFYRTAAAPEPREFYLLDELEAYVIAGRTVGGHWMPVRAELTFDDARAIARMKAGTLYRLTSLRLVPGQLFRWVGGDSEVNCRELRFAAAEFVPWAVRNGGNTN